MDGTKKLNKFSYWGDDGLNFDLVLDKFGVYLRKIYCPI